MKSHASLGGECFAPPSLCKRECPKFINRIILDMDYNNFNEEYDGVFDFPVRKREPLEDGHTSTRIVKNDEKLIFSELIKDHSGDVWESPEIA